MWRNLSIILFLIVLAQTANTSPIESFVKSVTTYSSTSPFETKIVDSSISDTLLLDENEPVESYNLPRISQACASTFSNEIQTTPNYIFVIEFFELKLTAGLFKNLTNPPVQLNWYEQLSHRSNSNRLSGWKDGNTLYASRTTYHS